MKLATQNLSILISSAVFAKIRDSPQKMAGIRFKMGGAYSNFNNFLLIKKIN